MAALAPTDRDDVLAVCLGSRVILWEPSSSRQLKEFFRLGGWPRVRLHDGRADAHKKYYKLRLRCHGRQTLYVTTMVEEKHKERLASGLFALRTETQGQPENRFYVFTLPLRL